MRQLRLLLFHLLCAVVPFAFWPWSDELFEFNKMILVYAFTIMIVATFAWERLRAPRAPWRSHPLLWVWAVWLLSQVLSTILSMHVHTSIFGYYSRFHGGLLSSLSYAALFFVAHQTLTRRDVLPLLRTLVLASLGVGLYAIPEHFGVSPSCVMIRGEFTVDCWIQDVRTRVFATFGQPNWLAAYMLMLWPLTAAWLSLRVQQGRVRTSATALALVIACVQILTLLYTRSRSGYIAFVVSAGILAVGGWWLWRRSSSTRRGLPALTAVAVATLLGTLVVGTPFSQDFIGKIRNNLLKSNTQDVQQIAAPTSPEESTVPTPQGTVLENGGTDSGTIRAIVWKGALAVWRTAPLFGTGLETFAYSYYQVRPTEHNLVSEWDFLYNKAHNEYLNILANAGLVGLTSTLALQIGTLLVCVIPLWKRPHSEEAHLGLALAAGLVGVHMSNALGFSTVMVAVLTALFPALMMAMMHEGGAEMADRRPAARDDGEITITGTTFVQAGVALVAFLALMSVAGMWYSDYLLAHSKVEMANGRAGNALAAITTATQRAPNQAEYWEQRALVSAQIAFQIAPQEATLAAQLVQDAAAASDRAIQANPVHLNLYRSRARTFIYLAQLEPQYLEEARATLLAARELAPTDPKVLYNLALIEETLELPQEAEASYQAALALKPNYEAAYQSYGLLLESQRRWKEAIAQYRHVQQLKPGETVSLAKIAAIEATQSAALR